MVEDWIAKAMEKDRNAAYKRIAELERELAAMTKERDAAAIIGGKALGEIATATEWLHKYGPRPTIGEYIKELETRLEKITSTLRSWRDNRQITEYNLLDDSFTRAIDELLN